MRMIDCVKSYIDPLFMQHEKARLTVEDYFAKFPSRILKIEIDENTSFKNGYNDNEKIYKIGLHLETGLVFLEYFEHASQPNPTMGLYVNKDKKSIVIKGSDNGRNLHGSFTIEHGKVKQAVQLT